jgi:hypothetical protein
MDLEVLKQIVLAQVDEMRKDPEFQAKVQKGITDAREGLLRLESWLTQDDD